MDTGVRVRLTKIVRSPRNGRLLPREGTLAGVTENLGRRLLLVAFEGGNSEYVFDNEVECVTSLRWAISGDNTEV
jgi:hypothetical protein